MQHLHQTPSSAAWERIGIKHHHGIVTPLFSLHSHLSCGIGEYLDLLPLFPWLKKCGFDTLQLLPLNDLGNETSPYSALSAFALNPLFISLAQLPYLRFSPALDLSTQKVDYKKVQKFKQNFLTGYYHQNFKKIQASDDYIQFVEKNDWLKPYALFKTLKILHHWSSWETWPDELKFANPSTLPGLISLYEDQVNYHIFLQFLCHEQLKSAKFYANESHIHLMGDIPILLNYESADVWYHKDLFLKNLTAGAPPDMFSATGQNWGFPLYNWKRLAETNYQWWRDRLSFAGEFYDIYRLDHIVGFFRIWAIPLNQIATQGQFIPANIEEWLPKGEKILRMIQESSSMLPIGEDLGVIPHEVRQCMKNLGICGTKVMRWERHWEGDQSFVDPKTYIPESLTTVSTHDSETLYQWWEKQPEEAQTYALSQGWEYQERLGPELAILILKESHCSGSLFHVNLLQEYLRLIPALSWPDPSQERINLPGTLSDENWTYRFKPSVEELIKNNELSDILRSFT